MRRRAVALIDGEHYPPVVVEGLRRASDRFVFVAALFLGGTEKIKSGDLSSAAEALYGVPVVFGRDWVRGLEEVIAAYRPEVIVDLSDEPVVGYEERFRLISHSLARSVGYVGSDFHFNPPSSPRLCSSPSVSIVGTAKRVGKTAISGYMARTLQATMKEEMGPPGVVVVAMGRGGPEQPEIIDGTQVRLTAADLLRWSREGRHAASDHFEDALLSRVVTVGCRRCGGGMAGEPFASNVVEGVLLANSLNPGLVIFEGSGASIPPVGTDARLLVVGGHQPIDHVAGYLGAYRVLTSTALVITMAEEPLATRQKVEEIIQAVRLIKPHIDVVPVVFRPHPVEPVKDRRVALFSTAPVTQQGILRRHLEERYECRVELVSSNLSDRGALKADLQRPEMAGVDTVLTEIKAAAVDVVAEAADERGLELVFVDNLPEEVAPAHAGDLAAVAALLGRTARERFVEQD